MRHIAYLRVSTDRQDVESQRQDVESIATDSTEWVVEHGSAWKKDGLGDRPEFKKIYDAVKSGKVERLYVWDLDRLYRKRIQAVGFLRLCKARGCVVLSFRQKYLSEIEKAPAPWNEIIYELIIQVLAAIAEEGSQKKSDRIKAKRRVWVRPNDKKAWGRPKAEFNERRAYHLLFIVGNSLQKVADDVGASKGTIHRFKNLCLKQAPSFIKQVQGQQSNDSEMRCSKLSLHNFTGLKNKDVCRWCKKTVKELS